MDGVNATVQGTGWLNDEQLQELAQDKRNRVFKYTHDQPERVMGADEARDRIREVRERYLALRSEHPEWEDDVLRHHICSEKYAWRQFAKTHNLNFVNATDRNTDEEKMKYQYYLLFVKKQVEMGQITVEQSRAMVNEYFLRESIKKAKPQPKKR